jgi:hypothetical protein
VPPLALVLIALAGVLFVARPLHHLPVPPRSVLVEREEHPATVLEEVRAAQADEPAPALVNVSRGGTAVRRATSRSAEPRVAPVAVERIRYLSRLRSRSPEREPGEYAPAPTPPAATPRFSSAPAAASRERLVEAP